MNQLDEKEMTCCQAECEGIESCDCQGFCTCMPLEDIDDIDEEGDCSACCSQEEECDENDDQCMIEKEL